MPRHSNTLLPAFGNQHWFRYIPPGILLSPGLAANADRESSPPAKVSAIHESETTRSPVGDVPPLRNSEPNLTRSDRHVLMPPSNIPVPTESTPIEASVRAPSLAHSSCDI